MAAQVVVLALFRCVGRFLYTAMLGNQIIHACFVLLVLNVLNAIYVLLVLNIISVLNVLIVYN